ncbi:calcium/sodium antiporter [Nannocystis bainbridge]|uniref:Calcium/sodium antiporter n=1 Tax=Nannocystis bainbridge TaxID=2995303 RepID=A0ABT5DUL2_9BACT|nr:calcium/sodium antiporter [Nannocystis bainbridge]MDC0717285.1 calcium/sodium antiporter [Nannocystis bainbridge]
MSAVTIALFVLGLVLLVVGAELLVGGAARLAARLGISPLVIGLTVVAFGTSAPELAVSVSAAMSADGADVALGNVVGSNIFNVLFILGVSALIAPLLVQRQLVRFDVPLMIVASGACWLMALDGNIGRVDGILLFAALLVYTFMLLRIARRAGDSSEEEVPLAKPGSATAKVPVQLAMLVAGLAMLVLGSGWLVDGAVAFARLFGVSELVIGLTIVAAGTSLPEVATSVLAAIRGQRDIAVGNVVGSCIFNIFCVLGISAAVAPGGVTVAPAALAFDIPVMTAVAISCLPLFLTGGGLARWEGALFLFYYVAYTAYLILASQQHEALATYGMAMRYVALPLTGLTLLLGLVLELKQRNARAA